MKPQPELSKFNRSETDADIGLSIIVYSQIKAISLALKDLSLWEIKELLIEAMADKRNNTQEIFIELYQIKYK
jgi:hypothetical protein